MTTRMMRDDAGRSEKFKIREGCEGVSPTQPENPKDPETVQLPKQEIVDARVG
jgi:hypothetical protein